MSSSTIKSAIDNQDIELLHIGSQETNSSEEEPSIVSTPSLENEKKILYGKGLYSTGSEDICNKYISMSDSTVQEHIFYNYPAVEDPGIEEAILSLEKPVTYPDDGKELYLQLCNDMNLCPVRMFYRNMLSSEINLSYYCVDPKGVQAMAKALQYNKYVTSLNFTDNFLNDDSCHHLGQMLKYNNTIKELILNGCRIGPTGLLLLLDNLRVMNRSLVTLNLARNQLGDSGGVYFAKILSEGAAVEDVNLSSNCLGPETALALADVLEWTNDFTRLNLSRNNFTDVPSTVKLLNKLSNSYALQELNLSFNSLEGDQVATAVCNILNTSDIQVLDLSYNRFRDEAINIMTSGLINAKNLISLNLSSNPMTPKDAYNTLRKMLRQRVKLQTLLMNNVCVNKSFVVLLTKVSEMENRKNFTVTYGDVLKNWTIEGPDPRELLLKRADRNCKKKKKQHLDVAILFLNLNKEYNAPVPVELLIDRLTQYRIPLNQDFVNELSLVFPGPKTRKSNTIDLGSICEFIKRLWPEKKLPLTPPPEPESPLPPPPLSAPSKLKKKRLLPNHNINKQFKNS